MAAKAAQEYPSLFNGIISGCPVLNLSGSGGIFASWVLRANLNASGEIILDEKFKDKFPKVKNTVFVAEGVVIVGDVEIDDNSNIYMKNHHFSDKILSI